jgi:hypothetical protein
LRPEPTKLQGSSMPPFLILAGVTVASVAANAVLARYCQHVEFSRQTAWFTLKPPFLALAMLTFAGLAGVSVLANVLLAWLYRHANSKLRRQTVQFNRARIEFHNVMKERDIEFDRLKKEQDRIDRLLQEKDGEIKSLKKENEKMKGWWSW